MCEKFNLKSGHEYNNFIRLKKQLSESFLLFSQTKIKMKSHGHL
jgi:hypothetical protein